MSTYPGSLPPSRHLSSTDNFRLCPVSADPKNSYLGIQTNCFRSGRSGWHLPFNEVHANVTPSIRESEILSISTSVSSRHHFSPKLEVNGTLITAFPIHLSPDFFNSARVN